MSPKCTLSQPDLEEQLHSRLGAVFQEALQQRCFSGAALLVARPHGMVFQATYGRVSHEPHAAPVDAASWFDLASLTKPLVTTPLAMVAITRGKLAVDEPLQQALAGIHVPTDKQSITIRQLLNHCSGLPAYRPYYRELIRIPQSARAAALLTWILREPLLTVPGSRCEYSDLGFLLLGEIVAGCLGMPLDQAARHTLFDPLEIGDLGFCPLQTTQNPGQPPARANESSGRRFVKTEICPWRKRLLAGEVDDENAYCLGGIAPHAGLFGTAPGVFRLLDFLWKSSRGTAASLPWQPGVVQMFWEQQQLAPGGTWAMGFDTPSPVHSSSRNYFSKRSVGHLGFTGTSFWLDLEREVLVVLLTNRIHPTRDNPKIKSFRPRLHNLVMETLHATNQH